MLSAETIVAVSNTTTIPKCPEEKPAQFTCREDLLRSLANSVDEFDQFFLVVRRGSSFQRQLKIWQRESKRNSPEKVLRVHFAGEDGIDSGAMAQEFVACAMLEIEKQFFPAGVPVGCCMFMMVFFLHVGKL